MNRSVTLAKYRAGTSAEARERVRLAMDAHDEAMRKRGTKGKRLQFRQARLPFNRQAKADFAMIAHDEALASK